MSVEVSKSTSKARIEKFDRGGNLKDIYNTESKETRKGEKDCDKK